MQVPEFRVAYSIKTDALDALYRRLKPKGVTMSGLLVKAAAAALAKFPDLYAGKHAVTLLAFLHTSHIATHISAGSHHVRVNPSYSWHCPCWSAMHLFCGCMFLATSAVQCVVHFECKPFPGKSLYALRQQQLSVRTAFSALFVSACRQQADQFVLIAACTPDGKGITYNEHINVAVAVTMPDGGLITPVIKVSLGPTLT